MFLRPMLALLAIGASRSSTLGAQQATSDAVILHGPHHAFTVSAPRGWVLDTHGGEADGLPAVLYRPGENWKSATVAMYVNTVLPDSGRAASARGVARADSVRLVARDRDMRVASVVPLRTGDGAQAFAKRFSSSRGQVFEVVAYVSQRTVTTILVVTSRDRRTLDAALPAFREFVRSYRWLTDSVVVR